MAHACELWQPAGDRAVELVEIAVGIVERAGEVIAQVREDVDAGVHRVDVVAVQLPGLVATRLVVGAQMFLDVLDHVPMLTLEQLQLRVDHAREARAAEHHASERYRSRCACAAASHVSSCRARSAPSRARSSAASSSSSLRAAAASASTSPAGTTAP